MATRCSVWLESVDMTTCIPRAVPDCPFLKKVLKRFKKQTVEMISLDYEF
jgi:hypothetical protein